MFSNLFTLAVFPVLVGPLQTLMALLPAILVSLGSMLFAIFKPGGFVRALKFGWRQKYFLAAVVAFISVWHTVQPFRFLAGSASTKPLEAIGITSEWSVERGGPWRLGRGPGVDDASAPGLVWKNLRDKTVISSPAVAGDRIIYSTATDIGPFSPEGRGAIVCVDALTGRDIWRYRPDNYRATFSSPVASSSIVVCGEGLHQVEDARITCLDLKTGQRRWEFRTKSHVESTAALFQGRVYVGAGSDGFYCLDERSDSSGQARVLWHLPASVCQDCESSPVVDQGVVYFGLGEGGQAICAAHAISGELLWKLPTPYPVFGAPTVAEGKLFLATGNGNYVQSAADLLDMKVQILRDDGASEQEIALARERWKPIGEVWCVNLATRDVEWKFATGDAILGAIAYDGHSANVEDHSIYFGSRDGHLYRVSTSGELLHRYNTHEPVVAAPAVGRELVYCSTVSGRLFCLEKSTLKPVWDESLGSGSAFSSSPILAHGHIYIGSAQQGLLCLGEPGTPPPPLWAYGEEGGSADKLPISPDAEVAWTYPPDDKRQFHVTAPMMPLQDCVYQDCVYAAGLIDKQPRLLKLSVEKTRTKNQDIWDVGLSGPVSVPIVGSGERLCLIEQSENTAFILSCRSTQTGQIQWTRQGHWSRDSVQGAVVPRLFLDHERVYLWTHERQFECFDLETGEKLWVQQDRDYVALPVTPSISSDLMFVAATCRSLSESTSTSSELLVAYDAPTGTELWHAVLSKPPAGRLLVEGTTVIVPGSEESTTLSIIDGALLQIRPGSSILSAPAPPQNAGRPVAPQVSIKGRAIIATDRGQVICLGSPAP